MDLIINNINNIMDDVYINYKNDISDIKDFSDIQKIKIKVNDLDKLLQELKNHITKLYNKQNLLIKFIDEKNIFYRDKIKEIKYFFNIKNCINNKNKIKFYKFCVGDPCFEIELPLYDILQNIPDMSYGILFINDNFQLIYKYHKDKYIICKDIIISNINYRNLYCENQDKCKYMDNCKYFHDKNLGHIQYFYKNKLVKNDNYFGSKELIKNQINKLSWIDLKSLASYCSIMNFYIWLSTKN